ncbi:Protein Tax-1 [Terramyces sp. JEL0728]|nr:Protein Tax-1 [Terramyces sp. JEL0728]
MYKVEILGDKIEQEAIERRRKLDTERKERIFNPKARILGVDVNALDTQIQIKNELAKIEKKRDETFDNEAKMNTQILQLMDEKVKEARRQQLKETNRYRILNQKTNQRREFDLYDPKALRNELPARVSDDDPRIGVSSLQKFEGEDLVALKRDVLQKEQMRVWTDEQLYEKERMKQAFREESRYN